MAKYLLNLKTLESKVKSMTVIYQITIKVLVFKNNNTFGGSLVMQNKVFS